MPTFDVWDIVKVPFPYTSRPVRQRWPGDARIGDLAQAGLPAASVVRPTKIATIEAADAEALGRLPEADRAEISRRLRNCLTDALE